MERSAIIHLIKDVLNRDHDVVFAYLYGSMGRVEADSFRDIDIGIYVKDPDKNPFVITSGLKADLSIAARQMQLGLTADQFDVRVINYAPFTFLSRIFKEGILLVDRDPEIRTDQIEGVSLKYRECAGLILEARLT